MHRTTIMLPADLKAKAQRRAKQLGISLGDFIRQAVTAALKKPGDGEPVDPFIADTEVYDGLCPPDGSFFDAGAFVGRYLQGVPV